MRNFLIKLSSIAALVFAASQVAHADVLVKNKNGRKLQLSIAHKIGRTSTEIPGNGMMIISGSEQALSLQLEDKDGNLIGKKVEIADGDRIIVRGSSIERTPGVESAEN